MTQKAAPGEEAVRDSLTLISLGDAVALGRPWAYAGPLFAGLGRFALLTGIPMPTGPPPLGSGSLARCRTNLCCSPSHSRWAP